MHVGICRTVKEEGSRIGGDPVLDAGGGRIGDAAYAEVIAGQLGSVVKTYLYGAASGPIADHRVSAYESGLKVSASTACQPLSVHKN